MRHDVDISDRLACDEASCNNGLRHVAHKLTERGFISPTLRAAGAKYVQSNPSELGLL